LAGDHQRKTGKIEALRKQWRATTSAIPARCSRVHVAAPEQGRDGPANHQRSVENDDVECTAALQARALRVVTETRCGMERTHAKQLRNIGNCVPS